MFILIFFMTCGLYDEHTDNILRHRLHGRGFQSKRVHDLETASKNDTVSKGAFHYAEVTGQRSVGIPGENGTTFSD